MGLPSKAQQIAAVMKFLDSDRNEGRELQDIAKDIVEGYHDALMEGVGKPATPLRQGMLFKVPVDGKVRRVAWLDGFDAWVVTDNATYGWLGSMDSHLWRYAEEFEPATFKQVDGKRKRVQMTPEEIEEAWSNPDWKVGQKVSFGQRQVLFEVIAVAPTSVLLRKHDGTLWAESSGAMEVFYRREIDPANLEW